MTANELQAVIDFEKNLQPEQPVLVKWTAGSFGHYKAEGVVKRVNRCSVRVVLTEEVSGEWGGYPVGREIVVPLITASGNRWAHFNRCEPRAGYQPVNS